MSVGGADFSVAGKITLGLETRGLEAAGRQLDGLQGASEKAASSLRKVGDSFSAIGAKSKQLGQTLTLGVTTPLVGLGILAVGAASDLSESINLVEKIFGDAGKSVITWSTTTADAMGIAQNAALEAAANFGGVFQASGKGADAAAKMSEQVIGLGASMASAFNTDPAQALDAIRSALIGESEPIRAYNVLLNEGAVAQEAVRLGLAATTGEVTDQAKVLARWSLIQQQTKSVATDFADTQDGLANASRRLTAQLHEAVAAIGQELLPVVLRANKELRFLLGRFRAFSPEMRRWVVIVGVAAAALGPILVGLGFVAQALGALAPLFSVLLGPVGLIIAALVLLGIAYRANIAGFGDAVRGLGNVFRTFVRYIKAVNADGDIMNDWLSHLPKPLQAAARLFGRLLNAIKKIGSGFIEMIQALIAGDLGRAFEKLRKLLAGIGDFLGAPAKAIGEFLKSITTGFKPLDTLVHRLGSVWVDFGRLIQEVFQGDYKGALAVGERLLGHFKDVIIAAFHLIGGGIGAAFDALRSVDWGAIIGRVLGALAGLAGGLWDTLTKAVAAIDWQKIWDTAVDAITTAADEGIDLGKIVLDAGVAFLGTLQDATDDLYGWIKKQLKVVEGKVIVIPKVTVRTDVELEAQQGDQVPRTFIQKLGDGLVRAASGLHRAALFLARNFAYLLGTNIGFAAGIIVTGVVVLIAALVTAIRHPIRAAQIALGFLDMIGRATVAIIKFLVRDGIALAKSLFDGFQTAFDLSTPDLSGLLPGILTAIGDASVWLLETGYDVITGLIDGASNRWPQFTHYLLDLLKSLPGYVGDAAQWLFNAGYDLITGFINGITARWHDLTHYLADLAGHLPEWIKGPLGIGSPSKVFMALGADTAAGFGLGFKDAWRDVEGHIKAGAISLAATPAPQLAPIGPGARNVHAGGVVINVSGAGDPAAVADHVYRALDAAFGRLELESRR